MAYSQTGNGNNVRPITNRASLLVVLQPGTSAVDAAGFVREWRARLNGASKDANLRRALVGAVVRGQTIDIVQRQISQGQTALELEIFGPDVARLQTIADNVIAAISQIPGVGLPDKNVTNSQPEVNVTIDRAKLIMSGLGTGDLAQFVDTATSGTVASFYQVNGIQYPIIASVRHPPRSTNPSSKNRSLR